MERERFELHKSLVGEITKGMEQVKQVKASSSNDQERLLESMLASYKEALSILTGSAPEEQCHSVITSSTNPPGSPRSIGQGIPLISKGYKKRKSEYTKKVIVGSPDDDGYRWRKFGMKSILNSFHPRSYFRCTHKLDMGCQATKQVQKSDDDSNTFVVTYFGEHTCLKAPPVAPHQASITGKTKLM